MLPHLSTTEKWVVWMPFSSSSGASASRVSLSMAATLQGLGSPASGVGIRDSGSMSARRVARKHSDSSPRSGTGTKSLSPIHTARSAKVVRIASIMVFMVLGDPKPQPCEASPTGKGSSSLSIMITDRPPEDGGDIDLTV